MVGGRWRWVHGSVGGVGRSSGRRRRRLPRRDRLPRGRHQLPAARLLGPDGAGRAERARRVRVRNPAAVRSEEHTSELQSQSNLVCRLLLEKKKKKKYKKEKKKKILTCKLTITELQCHKRLITDKPTRHNIPLSV